MNFLVDAQLPVRLVRTLRDLGHDAIHTSDLPEGNRTTDAAIAATADAEGRVVVTKDRDFRDGHLLHGSPRRLLTVATGSITNDDLLALVTANLALLVQAFDDCSHAELCRDRLIVHG